MNSRLQLDRQDYGEAIFRGSDQPGALRPGPLNTDYLRYHPLTCGIIRYNEVIGCRSI